MTRSEKRFGSSKGKTAVTQRPQLVRGIAFGHRNEGHQAQIRMVRGREHGLLHTDVAYLGMAEKAFTGGHRVNAEALPGGPEGVSGRQKPCDEISEGGLVQSRTGF